MSTTRMLVAVAVAGVVAAGSGSAFTASVTPDVASKVVGYGSQTISGATANSIVYNLTGDGLKIDTVDIVFSAALASGQTVKAAFNDGTMAGCTIDTTNRANVQCDVDQNTEAATKFAVTVS